MVSYYSKCKCVCVYDIAERIMSQTVLVTSCKGGIGKSTVAANLSMALAMAGYSVLAIDCDFRMRCLDLIMGFENSAVFNLYDVVNERCTLERAIVCDTEFPSLYFLSAPGDRHAEVSPEAFASLVEAAREYRVEGKGFDYIIIDAPAADDESIALSAPVCDQALIVCSHMPSAIRAAIFTSELLGEFGVAKQRLIINSFDVKSALMSDRSGIIEMIDSSKTMLLGIVPYDRALMIHQESGELINKLKRNNNARAAFINIAKRLCGRQIPLFEDFSGKDYKKVLKSTGE
ncbi:MAG: septum site-determining protein MinD [Ruminococcaceae bacterium]|nr:septum site-determining protein MinD [Oscillospiraceae bacterium]